MPREKSPTTGTARKRAPRKKAPPTVTSVTPLPPSAPFVGPEQRTALIAEAAYFRAEKRGFVGGHETEDWLAAEAEVDSQLLATGSAARV